MVAQCGCRALRRTTSKRFIACPSDGFRNRKFSTLGPKSDLTSEPEARAQCVSSARWDPRGGRPEPLGKGRPYRNRGVPLSGRILSGNP